MLRLPVYVKRQGSPIYTYLRSVYRTEVSLPFDLRKLEAFYPALLPTAPCVLGSPKPDPPRSSDCYGHDQQACSAACATWQPRPAPSAAAVAAFLVNRSFIRTQAATAADAQRPFGHVVVLQAAPPKRKAVPQRAWAGRASHTGGV